MQRDAANRKGNDLKHIASSSLYANRWVTRDRDGKRAKPLWPYFAAPRDVDALKREKPILVSSCWNGAVAYDARWFMDKEPPRKIVSDSGTLQSIARRGAKDNATSEEPTLRLPLRFRTSSQCLSSECLLTSLDMHRALKPYRPWIFMNPTVVVGEHDGKRCGHGPLVVARLWVEVILA